MKASITKEELIKNLTVVAKGMSSRSTLPILSGILITASDKSLIFQTTDLEVFVKSSAAAFVEEEGSVVVSGKLLSEIVRNLPDAAVELYTENEMFLLECMSSRFTLNTLDVNDFPVFPSTDATREISLPPMKVASMVKQVVKAVSKDESRAVLTGIYMRAEKNEVRFVATDSYRLAIATGKLETPVEEPFDVIIPGRAFEEITKSAASENTLSMGIAENQIAFTFGNTIFITRKIEGNYPNYNQLIPSEKNVSVRVNNVALLAAVKRVALMTQSHSPIKFAFSVTDQSIEISSRVKEVGGAVENVDAEVVGQDVEIGFNHQFVIDGLSSIDSDDTLIEVQTSLKPGIFKATGEAEFLYLAMPVRLV